MPQHDNNPSHRYSSSGAGRIPVDWPAIAEAVARDMLGDPSPRLSPGRELRWRNKGSFRLNIFLVDLGQFRDAGAWQRVGPPAPSDGTGPPWCPGLAARPRTPPIAPSRDRHEEPTAAQRRALPRRPVQTVCAQSGRRPQVLLYCLRPADLGWPDSVHPHVLGPSGPAVAEAPQICGGAGSHCPIRFAGCQLKAGTSEGCTRALVQWSPAWPRHQSGCLHGRSPRRPRPST